MSRKRSLPCLPSRQTILGGGTAMSDPKDPKDPKLDKPDAPATGGEAPADNKRSGRVAFDSRGNSVWEWQLETGVYSRDITTQKLKKLNLGELSIAESAIESDSLSLADDASPAPGGGFNPYNAKPRSKQEGSNPYDNFRNIGNKVPSRDEPVKKPRSLDDLRKLSEVIKAQRNKNKDKGGG